MFLKLQTFVFLANLPLELSMPSMATNKWSLGKVNASCFLLLMAILDRLTRSRCLNFRADEKSNSAFDLQELLKLSIPAQISHLLWLLYLLKRTGSVNKYQHDKHAMCCSVYGHTGEGGERGGGPDINQLNPFLIRILGIDLSLLLTPKFFLNKK